MNQETLKRKAAAAALRYIENADVIGVGSGTTVSFFIELLAENARALEGVVAASSHSEAQLRARKIPTLNLNDVNEVPVYVDGADEATRHLHLLKGGGGALTREKILAAASAKFVCIIDGSKLVGVLGGFPLAVEVVPMARSYVAREIVKLGGRPALRQSFTSDNGNIILDAHNLDCVNPVELETRLNQIAGVVSNGLFTHRRADVLLVARDDGVETMIAAQDGRSGSHC